MKTKALVLGFALVLLATSFGFLPRAAAQDVTGAHGGDLVVALQDFGDVDPTASAPADRKVLELLYDSLGRVDPVTLRFVPWAATGWTYDGAKNITVTLRNDLRFSDGVAYDADAVAKSLNTYMKSGVQRWNAVKVNDWTVRLDFTAIPATWNYKVNNEAAPGLFFTEGLSAFIAWNEAGVRKYSGPFSVATETATSLRIVPNENHFAVHPNLDSITYKWPYTVQPDANGRSLANDAGCALLFQQVHLIGWNLQTNDLTNTRDCVATFGGFPDDPSTTIINESLRSILNPDQNLTKPHVLTAKNAGTDFLYFGFAYNTGSVFAGAPGSQGQMLRSAVYQFVNKGLYRNVEPNSRIAHGLQNQFNTPWSPRSCAPWTPCNTIVEAATVTAPAPVNQRTNTDPGIQALDVAGILDRNADGWRETSAGVRVTFSILAPSFTLDPRKTTMANDMQFLLASAQLDGTVQPFDTWAALDAAAAACTTNCVYIKRYTAATQLPDWVYDMPEIRASGDTAADLHLNLGARYYTLADRTLHVGHVSHLVGAAADILPVVHFDTLEGFDFQSFSGWVNTFGGINNFWSFANLRLPALGGLHARLSVFPTGIRAGQTGAVTVEVRDDSGLLVSDAEVWLSTSGMGGALQDATGMTLASGTFRTNFIAAGVVNATDDTIWVTVTKTQYTADSASVSLAVHPALARALSVVVTQSDPDHSINYNQTAAITVTVMDGTTALAGAKVVLSVNLPGGVFTDASGTTNANGVYTTTFTPNVRQGMAYEILAEVSATGFDSASDTVSLRVGSNPGTVTPTATTRNVPGFEAVAAIGAVALTFALVALARRRRED